MLKTFWRTKKLINCVSTHLLVPEHFFKICTPTVASASRCECWNESGKGKKLTLAQTLATRAFSGTQLGVPVPRRPQERNLEPIVFCSTCNRKWKWLKKGQDCCRTWIAARFPFFMTILQKQVDSLPTDDKQITQRQYYERSLFFVRRKTGVLHSLCVRARDLLYLSFKACKLNMVNGFANHEYYKLSSVYRLHRLFNPSGSSRGKQWNSFCSLITIVRGYWCLRATSLQET